VTPVIWAAYSYCTISVVLTFLRGSSSMKNIASMVYNIASFEAAVIVFVVPAHYQD
jgi:hypothetical protein